MPSSAKAPISQRTQSEDRAELDAATQAWINQLPPHLQPQAVAAQYPRIANKLARLWPESQSCRPYLEELLLDNRGTRKGFPVRVALELAALKSFYDSAVFPTAQTVWDELAARIRATT